MKGSRDTQHEWHPYRIIFRPQRSRWVDPDCQQLETVFHVAHVPDACRILEDRKIKAGLIGDESRLKETRTTVAWLSANSWAYGSIYGNVQFSFSWNELIAEKRIFWVEAMTKYNPSAYRFLITGADAANLRGVIPYRPRKDEGPLRLIDDTWFWNGSYTSEFMFDMDISLRRCSDITFISHNSNICRLEGSSCSDRNRRSASSGAQVLAFAISRGLRYASEKFVSEGRKNSAGFDHQILDSLECLLNDLSTQNDFGGPLRREASRIAALTGALSLYGHGASEDAREICRLFASREELKASLEGMASDFLAADGLTIPEWSNC